MSDFKIITIVNAEGDTVSCGVMGDDYNIDSIEDIIIKKYNQKERILLKYKWLQENHPEYLL